MTSDSKLTPREILERKHARLLADAAALERDMAEFDRIATTWGLDISTVGKRPKKPAGRAPKLRENKHHATNGSVASLVHSYLKDERASYHGLRFRTRKHYDSLIKRLLEDCRDDKLADLKADDITRLHQSWSKGGKTAMGHAMVGMLRILINYGATVLNDDQCVRLSVILRSLRFATAGRRDERLTAEQIGAIISMAHEMGMHSIALAQAFQFDCGLGQRDVIGEWVPQSEPELSDVLHNGSKWLRGLRWDEIDENMILRHRMSADLKQIEINLRNCPTVATELARIGNRPKTIAVIVCERDGLPWDNIYFRRMWRKVADKCGIPKNVRNMDTRPEDKPRYSHAGAA